jgi:hypothetical protein
VRAGCAFTGMALDVGGLQDDRCEKMTRIRFQ